MRLCVSADDWMVVIDAEGECVVGTKTHHNTHWGTERESGRARLGNKPDGKLFPVDVKRKNSSVCPLLI